MANTKNRKIGFFLVLSTIFLIVIVLNLKNYLITKKREQQLKAELKKWEAIVKQEPNYPDSWAKLAVIWFDLGRKDLSLLTLEEAENLAPFRNDLKQLKEEIEQK
jgi:cytochrome c-type biogenesis protein CcmH/NrfG